MLLALQDTYSEGYFAPANTVPSNTGVCCAIVFAKATSLWQMKGAA